jgi:hypothetical protein
MVIFVIYLLAKQICHLGDFEPPTHFFHAIRQHTTRRGTMFAWSNRPNFLVSVLSRLLASPHPLLIDLKLSKNSGMIMIRCRTFSKDLKFFNETGKYFVSIQ